MAQPDIKIEEIDIKIEENDDNIDIGPNDIDVQINEVDLKGEDHCPTCGLWPSYHSMETRKKNITKNAWRKEGIRPKNNKNTINTKNKLMCLGMPYWHIAIIYDTIVSCMFYSSAYV